MERTKLTLDQAAADPVVVRAVGAPVLALARAVTQHLPDGLPPLEISTAPWPPPDEWPEGWEPPADHPYAVYVWRHPAFHALLTDLAGPDPRHAKHRAALICTHTTTLRERYWQHVDDYAALRAARSPDPEALAAAETEAHAILIELANRGERLTPD